MSRVRNSSTPAPYHDPPTRSPAPRAVSDSVAPIHSWRVELASLVARAGGDGCLPGARGSGARPGGAALLSGHRAALLSGQEVHRRAAAAGATAALGSVDRERHLAPG